MQAAAAARTEAVRAQQAQMVARDPQGAAEDLENRRKALASVVPAVGQLPDLTGARAAIEDHFNAQYAAPEANAKQGWFNTGEYTEAAAQKRREIDRRKAQAQAQLRDFELRAPVVAAAQQDAAEQEALSRARQERLRQFTESKARQAGPQRDLALRAGVRDSGQAGIEDAGQRGQPTNVDAQSVASPGISNRPPIPKGSPAPQRQSSGAPETPPPPSPPLQSAVASAAESALYTAAGGADVIERALVPLGLTGKSYHKEDQPEYERLQEKLFALGRAEPESVDPNDTPQLTPQQKVLYRQLKLLEQKPRAERTSGQLATAAQQTYDYYSENPILGVVPPAPVDRNSQNASAQIGRGTGKFVAILPSLLSGPASVPLSATQAGTEAYERGYAERENQLRAAGETEESAIQEEAEASGTEEGIKATLAMAAYLGAGKLAGKVVPRLLPGATGPRAAVAASTAGAATANVVTGSVLRALEGERWQPTLETLTMDALFAAFHARAASGTVKARIAGELARRQSLEEQSEPAEPHSTLPAEEAHALGEHVPAQPGKKAKAESEKSSTSQNKLPSWTADLRTGLREALNEHRDTRRPVGIHFQQSTEFGPVNAYAIVSVGPEKTLFLDDLSMFPADDLKIERGTAFRDMLKNKSEIFEAARELGFENVRIKVERLGESGGGSTGYPREWDKTFPLKKQ